MKKKQLWRKVVVPLIPLTFLDTRSFLKLGRVSVRTFSVVWDNTFATTNRDPLPLSTKYFNTRKFLKHRKVPPPKLSGVFRQKIFDGKFWYSPFLFINLLANDTFPKHSTGLSAYDVIRYCKTKNFWQKIVILSSSQPSSPKISSISEFFWNTEGFPYEIFRHCGPTIFL